MSLSYVDQYLNARAINDREQR